MSQRYTGSVSSMGSVNFPGGSAHTVCGWIYLSSSGGAGDLMYMDVGGNGGEDIWIGYNAGNFFWEDLTSGVGFTFSQALTTGAWTHLALVWDGTNCIAYKNGAVVSGPTLTVLATRANADGGDIAAVGGGDFTAQDVMVFAQALSAAQIQETMRLALPAGVSGYAWYKLLNATPTLDSTGNSHTLSGAGDANGTQILVAAIGGTNVTGTATVSTSSSVAITGSGLTRTTGAVAIAAAAGLSLVGSTQTTGAVAMARSVSLTASGSTQSTGTAVFGMPIASVGSTQATGAGSVAASAALTSVGATNVVGIASISSSADPGSGSGVAKRQTGSVRRTVTPFTGRRQVRC